MNRLLPLLTVLCCCATIFAQTAKTTQPTIDLEKYRNAKKYALSEATYTVGTHAYRLVNIKPKTAGDTTCITAVVIDKRKYVLVDLQVADAPHGLVVPKQQPIEGGLIVVKVSPIDAKTFIVLPSGKMVTLPGDRLIVDVPGSTALCLWDNQGQWNLTVFDYRKLNLMVQPTQIVRPSKWYTNGLGWIFKAANEEGYYSLDLFTKSVTAVKQLEAGAEEVAYTFDPSLLTPAQCCGKEALTK